MYLCSVECVGMPVYSLHVLPLYTAWSATTEGAGQGEVDVLLAVHSYQEGGHIHYLLADAVSEGEKKDGPNWCACKGGENAHSRASKLH